VNPQPFQRIGDSEIERLGCGEEGSDNDESSELEGGEAGVGVGEDLGFGDLEDVEYGNREWELWES